ncbi:MAG: PAS domain-containing protein, partial [Betaproteobacteria bacterium]
MAEPRTAAAAGPDSRRGRRLGRTLSDLRLRLVLLVLLSFGPPAALLFTSELQWRRDELGGARRELTRAAAVAGAEFDARLKSAQLLLAGLANVAAIRDAQEPRCSALLGELLAKGAGLGGLFVLDPAGRTVCSATPGPRGRNFADRDYFRETVTRRAPTLGAPLLARPDGKALLGVGHPLFGDDGELRGVLVTSLDLSAFAEQLAVVYPVAGAAVTLIGAHGEILFRYPDGERWLGQRLPDAALVRAALASTLGTVAEVRGLDAVDRIYALAPLAAETGQALRLALGVARSDIDGPVNEILRGDFAAMALLAVLTLAAALWIAERSVHAPARRVLDLEHAERAHALSELAAREGRMQLQAAALSAAANGIVITDRDGTIRWVNEAFSRLTGYSAGEAIGSNPRILKSGVHRAEFYTALYRCVVAGEVWRGEMVNRRKDGSRYTEDQTITPVRSDRGEITHFIAIKQDVSER